MYFLTTTKNLKKKLTKKWRFWRNFKRFFLRYKKKLLFLKIKKLCSQIFCVKKQYSQIYGKKIQRLIKKKNLVRFFGGRFFYSLAFLEIRLNILLLRMLFTQNLIQANFFIHTGMFLVNNKKKNKNYLLKIGDLVQKPTTVYFDTKKINRKWRKHIWSQWSWKSKKATYYLDPFLWSKNNLNLNYTEVNHKILSGILIRKPLLGEILISNKKRLLTISLLKKFLFIY